MDENLPTVSANGQRLSAAALAALGLAAWALGAACGVSPPGPGGPGDPPAPPPPDHGPEPLAWLPTGLLDLQGFPRGVASGDAAPDSVVLSVQTTDPGVDVVVMRGDEDGWVEVVRQEGLTPNDHGVVQTLIDGLWPDHTYNYAFYAPGGMQRSAVGRFRTALRPGTSRVMTFGATSCLGGPDAPWPTLGLAADEKLDFMLYLGDTVYADGSQTLADYRDVWSASLDTPGLRNNLLSTSEVATWDDHEVDNDWTWANDASKVAPALTAFREAMPQRMGSGDLGIWRALRWGDALDLFVLDSRGERLGGRYISLAQMNWLKSELLASTARFKIILNSVPITDESALLLGVMAEDRWDGYPDQQAEIVKHIDNNAIDGVLWVAGDHHFGALFHVGRPGNPGHNQWEALVGPAGYAINTLASLRSPDDQYELFIDTWTWTRFEAYPDTGIIRLQWIDDFGAVVEERTLWL